MKSLVEIITQIRNYLKSINSPLQSFTPYSNIYALLRSIGSVLVDQYDTIYNYYSNSFIRTSSGEDLDYRLLDFGLLRNEGSFSRGSVLVTSNISTNIPEGTILSSPLNTQQFRTLESNIANPSGVFIPIESINASNSANLEPNTNLVSSLFPNVTFTVGSSRNIDGSLSLGTTGGLPPETDESFKLRYFSHISNLSKGTLSSIANVLTDLGISKFFIKEHYPITGYFTIYLNTVDQSLLDLVEDRVIVNKPVGTSFEVKSIVPYFIDVRFVITLGSLDLSESVFNNVRNLTFSYFDSFELGQIFYPNNLAILCSNIPGVVDVRIVEPSLSKISVPSESLIRLRNIYMTINN